MHTHLNTIAGGSYVWATQDELTVLTLPRDFQKRIGLDTNIT